MDTFVVVVALISLISSFSGVFCMYHSSFLKFQFSSGRGSRMLEIAPGIAFLIVNVGLYLRLMNWVRKSSIDNLLKPVVKSVYQLNFWLVTFFIKYNHHDFHFNSCAEEILESNSFMLVSFALLPLLVLLLSSKKPNNIELGLFSAFIGLLIETSMETITNLRYILVIFLWCCVLFFLQHYIVIDQIVTDQIVTDQRNIWLIMGELFSAILAVLCLFLSPCFREYLKDNEYWQASIFIAISFCLAYFLTRLPEYISKLVNKCDNCLALKVFVKCSILSLVSLLVFMSKHPRFRLHSKEHCRVDKGVGEVESQRNVYDIYTAASFAVLALTLSSSSEGGVPPQPQLGMFSFFVQLTMDTSIENMGDDSWPNHRFISCAFVFCFVLIFIKSYWESEEVANVPLPQPVTDVTQPPPVTDVPLRPQALVELTSNVGDDPLQQSVTNEDGNDDDGDNQTAPVSLPELEASSSRPIREQSVYRRNIVDKPPTDGVARSSNYVIDVPSDTSDQSDEDDEDDLGWKGAKER